MSSIEHHAAQARRPKPFSLEPAHVSMRDGCAYTGDSRSRMYEAIAEGKVEAVKEGNRTLLVFESLKKRVAERPRAAIGVGNEKFREMRKLAGPKRRRRRKSAK
jgi:hypothetical protein